MRLFILTAFVLTFILSVNAQQGLQVNDMAPDFTAMDQNGNKINLKEVLEKGPAVVVFYRGQWCPYCNQQLKKLEDSMSLVSAKGATIIAISPETAENISKTVEKTKATYPILHDEGMNIMKSYDVAFAVDEKTIEKYKGYGIDFIRANGAANGANLPVPALYIINKEGKIIFRHFDKNYTKRVSVAEVLSHL
ncbi:MAG: peroxiredoxin-like family protein [Bacteroidetes bacterium]|nr:peroxiredoxin-like family protein [Bacteroidota bacterium]